MVLHGKTMSGCGCFSLQSPWGSVAPVAPACSLADVMSEQLARQMEEEENAFPVLTE